MIYVILSIAIVSLVIICTKMNTKDPLIEMQDNMKMQG